MKTAETMHREDSHLPGFRSTPLQTRVLRHCAESLTTIVLAIYLKP